MDFNTKKRIVIKVGSSNISYKSGQLNIRRIEKLIRVMSDIKNSGKEIIFVTSGAQSAGMGLLGFSEKPKEMPLKQACAAVGQNVLMTMYDSEFSKYNHIVAQMLVTRDVFSNKERRANVENTFKTLLEMGVIPIINANDSVSLEGLDFDENDTLSAMVAKLIKADLLILLSDVDGLYDMHPSNKDAKLIPEVDVITSEMIAASREHGSSLGSGGMLTKLEAAMIAKEDNIETVIMSGENPENLYDLFDNKAKCTLFK